MRAERRAGAGKGKARRLRRAGYVPGVVYGHDEEAASLKVRTEELEALLGQISVDNTLIDLQVDGEDSRRVLIREVQRHPFKPEILHIDFFHIRAGEKIRVAVPLHLTGRALGVEEGGVLQQQRHDIEVECLPREIPDQFELDVSELGIGDALRVGDVNVGGLTLLEDLDAPVCAVLPPTVVKVEEEVEELEEGELEEGEPEVIGEAEAPGEGPAREAPGEGGE
ncbi:MAG: 50S ribosomal protein L25 [Gemmatimonadota bacterium]